VGEAAVVHFGSSKGLSTRSGRVGPGRLLGTPVPVRRSTLGDRSFSVAAPGEWNSLPSAVRVASSLTTFRQELKTFSFSLEFSGPLVANSLFPPMLYDSTLLTV